MDIDRTAFIAGLIVGAVIAGGFGYISGRIRLARNAMRSPDRPMTIPTQNTPRSVMEAAAAALRQCLFWSIVMVLFVGIVVFLIFRILAG